MGMDCGLCKRRPHLAVSSRMNISPPHLSQLRAAVLRLHGRLLPYPYVTVGRLLSESPCPQVNDCARTNNNTPDFMFKFFAYADYIHVQRVRRNTSCFTNARQRTTLLAAMRPPSQTLTMSSHSRTTTLTRRTS